MLTTITTTTVTTTATLSYITFLGTLAVIALILLLIAKELLGAIENEKAYMLGRYTSIAINPLLFTFIWIVTLKVIEVIMY
ncbi:MAG: hypothetical protein DRN12_06290 [Thermoplasmata archaeon]|nr:MAG: hypothetical protein DRN12_06290 [Thermoplasmata archaeon]